jgi:two-component system KDP operon response regulator KdpE
MIHANHPVMHAKLLSAVWGSDHGGEKEYLRTFIMQLRKKIEDDPAHPVYLKTVNYLGYVFTSPSQPAQ